MAKGKKNVLRTNKKPEDTVAHLFTSQTDTKENKPATNEKIRGLCSPSKPRSPLSDGSSMLIQEGNDSDVTNTNTSRLKKDVPTETKSDSCESKEQQPDMPSLSQGKSEQTNDKLEQSESTRPTGSKASAPKSRNRTGRKAGAKKTENKPSQNRKVTDYYPIRRSNRKTKSELKNEEHSHIDDLIKNGTEEGMQVKHMEAKGRGVFAVKSFKKGDFVVEYHGDLLDLAEAKTREAKYAQNPETGCYMYYFQYQSKTYCVDATQETKRLGRLINHSKNGNCQTRLHPIDGTPHLILVASRDIEAEEELLYDYGDRSKDSILAHPWLKS
ncbi:lysine methyltransferase 5Ab isoform X2 [Mugil cephalus]|uniref:lysine methyltransferase 5Ab isoform X2 n=1 Tax=Mugil cephalus TaxID=48193 RepID=UPI001FB64D67|nr:lysine methyltransferase 5Ab isoform X2 [Mugil cephalus]